MDADTTRAMLCRVHPEWAKIFIKHREVRAAFCKALSGLKAALEEAGAKPHTINEHLIPHLDKVLEPFCYFPPANMRVIIVGQDPYPTEGHACGLCFSVAPNVQPPRSLANIYACLQNTRQIPRIPVTGDLRPWARQGVLMLNRYLTRIKGSDKLHHFWGVFTNTLLYHLSRDLAREFNYPYVAVFLWGREARELRAHIDSRFEILEWCHPSPMVSINNSNNPQSFRNCNHFRVCNEALTKRGLPPINWDPGNSQIPHQVVAYTDGGCHGNGAQDAMASYGVYFAASYGGAPTMLSKRVYGLVPKKAVEIRDGHLVLREADAVPTNNRGELMAIMHALAHVSKMDPLPEVVTIVSDSTYAIGLLEKRLNRYTKEELRNNRVLNSDLVEAIRYYVGLVGAHRLKVVHQRGHTTAATEHAAGNREADALCNRVLSEPEIYSDYLPRVE